MGKRRSIESKTRVKRTKTRKTSVGAYNNDTTRPNLVESLPNDVIAEIVSRVAASSLTDLFRCKLSCKALEQIGKEKYVIRQVDMEDFDFWRLGCNHKDAAIAYSQLCADSDNPGALFRQGMKLYFRDMKVQQGMESLEKAAKLGHRTSAYALGLILLVCGGGGDSGSERHKAMELIKACTGKGIVNCRIRLRKCVRDIWWHTKFVTQCKPVRFDKHDNCPRKCPWTADSSYLSEDHNNDALCCEACTFEFESKFFCKLFS